MLKTLGTVDTNSTVNLTSEDDWCRVAELDHSSWSMVQCAILLLIEVGRQDWGQVVLEIPDLDSAVVCHTGKDRGGEWGPADVIDLLLERFDLPAGHLWIAVLLMPDFDSPIVGAGQEDWAVLWMPEWVATHPVDGTLMTEIPVGVSLTKGRGALVYRAVLSSHEVVVALFVGSWEVDGQSSSWQESDAFVLLHELSTCVHIWLVWIGLSLELLEFGHLKTLPHGPLNDATITRDRDQELTLAISLDPMDLPDDVSMLTINVFTASDWHR